MFASMRSPWRTAAAVCALFAGLASLPFGAADQTAADYYVRSLPGAPEPLLKMHAGSVGAALGLRRDDR